MTTTTASQLGAGDDITAPVRVGELVADKYLVERTLGVGGMGVVVLARDQVLDRLVAIKFLLPKLAGSETAVQRFVREARAATRVTSEHVVRLLEIEKLPSGTPFFVMEYVEGSDLRALLRERGALSPRLAVDYALQALQAVAEGHVKGIVHRDIKPSNLFLCRRADGTPLIKVLDFGIAKTVESDAAEASSLTSSEDVRLGSPAYMPPEQLQDPRDVDNRSDIWSLGATLYELICGRPPFEGQGYLELASRILRQPPTPLAEQDVPHPVPRGLEQVLHKCLEKSRDARYANAAELAVALAPFGSDDARMSLSRVSGMFASSSSFPALTSSIPLVAADGEATLDVAGSQSSVERPARLPDAVVVTPPVSPRRGRAWVVVGAAALAVLGLAGLREPASVPFTQPSVTQLAATPHDAVALPSAGRAPSSAAVRKVGPVQEPPPKLTVSAPAKPPASSGPAKSPAFAAAPARSAASPAVATEAALRAAEPAVVGAGQVAPATSERSSSGRSAEIERLIERRR